ncbi:MAG: hypothetical protein KKF12_12290 [Proteobacteria bacterium]|nr:hypothetical protein [Desulfobacula sp.]MBU3951024.1 hypothetical protein [Pseudomonadota bacterium]MBU4009513.1 hypothetical protein [Pseudomonadota bacterium]MBU4131592.1 hypothetical protein [Pseudomonadota bacterium]
MIMYKYPIEESDILPSKTKLDFIGKIESLPIELATFLNDREAKITMDEKKQMLTVESSLLSGDEIDNAVEKCLLGLSLACSKRIRSTF